MRIIRTSMWEPKAGLVLVWLAGTTMVAAQSSARATAAEEPPVAHEVLVEFNKGLLQYLEKTDVELVDAVAHFDRVLESDPGNAPARLLRALTFGRIALSEEIKARRHADEIRLDDDRRKYRSGSRRDRERMNERIAELKELRANTDVVTEQVLLGRSVSVLEHRCKASEMTDQDRKASEVAADASQRASHLNYTRMRVDLEELVGSVVGASNAQLPLAVCLTKLAKLDEERGETLDTSGEGDPTALFESAARHLKRAAEALAEYLGTENLSPGERVRARFYASVVSFRRALPKKRNAPGEAPVDLALLNETSGQLTLLAGDITAILGSEDSLESRRWRSYTALYSGLVETSLALNATDRAQRAERIKKAKHYFHEAAELDTVESTPDAQQRAEKKPSSISGEVIPDIAVLHLQFLEQLGRAGIAESDFPLEDLEFSLSFNAQRDSNVVLLGERTDLPRGIEDEEDFGLGLGMSATYSLDLDKHGSENLAGWTVAAQARTNQLWHHEVDEFDEEIYGGSFVLQYELRGRGNPDDRIGRTVVALQYDYDHFLLGRAQFLDSHRMGVSLQAESGDTHDRTALAAYHSIRNYHEPLRDIRLNRSGTYTRFALGHSHRFDTDFAKIYEAKGLKAWGHKNDEALAQDDEEYPARYVRINGGLQYGWDSTDGDEFDAKVYGLSFGIEVPLPYGWTLSAASDFERQEYQKGSVIDFHRRPRDDFVQSYEVSASRLYVLRGGELANRYERIIDRTTMEVALWASWTVNDSNVLDRQKEAVFEYDRAVYGISLRFGFN